MAQRIKDAPWEAMRTQYVQDASCSYRKLEAQYGVSRGAIAGRAQEEDWAGLRRACLAKSGPAMVDALVDRQVERAKRVHSIADTMLDKLEAAMEEYDIADMLKDKRGLQALTGALRTLKEIQDVRCVLDDEEQRARIAALRKQAEREEASSEITVRIAGGDKAWQE